MAIAAGTRLGPYEVVSPLGAGGMGEVWKGRDTRLDRSVAIKILPASFEANAELKLRFQREARTISQLNHPNICTLYDVGESYLVMELLEGESLADRLAKGPLPLEQVLRYGTQIADGLDKAHRQGIIHRDVKPGNIMLTKSGAKLLDFGLAKTDASVIDVSSATEHRPLTEEGTILGTFQYMAPEQLEGVPADARTDIFALGALLYEMATGKRAFDGKTKTSLIAAIVSAEPAPMSHVQPLTPPALEHVVRKCLAKEPDDRWQSAHDIAEEMRWISEAGSQAGVAAPLAMRRKSRERLGWVAAIVVALIVGALSWRALRHETLPVYRFAIPMIDAGYKFGTFARLSPDGQTIYFRALNASGKNQIFRRRFDELSATPIAGTEDALWSTVSPDGRNLLLNFSAGIQKRISSSGGPLETVVEGVPTNPAATTSSTDGTILVGGSAYPIRRVLPGGKVEQVTTLAPDESGHDFPLFIPDSRNFLFLATYRDAARGTVRRVLCATKLGSKEITRIGAISSRVEYAQGRLFFVRDGTLMSQPFDASNLKFTGEAVPVAEGVAFSNRSGYAAFSVANNGTVIWQPASEAQRLLWIDASGKKVATIRGPESLQSQFAILPDGSRVIASVNDRRTGTFWLWTFGLDRESATRVTFSPAGESYPVVTPDGSRVFFAGDAQSAAPDIYEAPMDGSTAPKLVVSAPGFQLPADLSPDGRFLLYTSNQNQSLMRQDLYILPLTGDSKPYPFLATPAIENEGVFCPDGKWIAYTSDATGVPQIYVKPFPGPGAARPVSAKGGRNAHFSGDGRKIYFRDQNKLMVADFGPNGSTTEARLLFELDDQIYGFLPVGDRFLMILQNEAEASPPVRVITGWQPPAK